MVGVVFICASPPTLLLRFLSHMASMAKVLREEERRVREMVVGRCNTARDGPMNKMSVSGLYFNFGSPVPGGSEMVLSV